jgi:hypothetical protein
VSNLENPTSYRERVLPPAVSLWPALLVIPTAYLTLLSFNELAGLVLGPLFCLGILASIWFAAPVIEIDSAEFSVGEAVLPRNVITGVEVIRAKEVFAERGPRLSPAAYVRFQLGVNQLIKVTLADPEDQTPYWLIATRKPDEIAKFLSATTL